MPSWFRAVAVRCLLRRTALHADAQGIWGSADPQSGSAGPCPCPWQEVTDVVVWQYDHLRIVGLARRSDAVEGGTAARARALASRAPQQPARRRSWRRHPDYPAFISPDGSPYGVGNVLTTNGWCVDVRRLEAVVRHFAPRARFLDLSTLSVAPQDEGPFGIVFEIFDGLIELIGWRRLGWLFGVAVSIAVLAVASASLGSQGHTLIGAIGVAAGALALASFSWRAVAVRRRKRRAARPEAWLGQDREVGETGLLSGLRRSRLAAWVLPLIPRAVLRGRRPRRISRPRRPA
jgi:hypothetical protein